MLLAFRAEFGWFNAGPSVVHHRAYRDLRDASARHYSHPDQFGLTSFTNRGPTAGVHLCP